jgi:3',5'-cyclic AMP phosphodiesterase CpdA
MILLAHISDIHLGPLPALGFRDYLAKPLFGFMNWHQNRAHIFDPIVLDSLLDDLQAAKPDHIAVTGDIVNLGLEAEFVHARSWLTKLGDPRNVTVIPGNHDAYVPRSMDGLNRAWRPFMEGEVPTGRTSFPFIRRRGSLAIIGVSTAIATPPFMATGRVGVGQAEALGRALAETGEEGLCRIVLIHHPPGNGSTSWHRRLIGTKLVHDAIAGSGAELVLHGHNHRTSVATLSGPDGPVPVVGASAASIRPNGHAIGGAYNLIRIEGAAPPYTITMTERGFCQSGAVETITELNLSGGPPLLDRYPGVAEQADGAY